MSKVEMFMAMILTNAKREEAHGVMFIVENDSPRIDLLFLDGSSQTLMPPPPEILVQIIESLESGQRRYQSGVFEAIIDRVKVQRGLDNMSAHVSVWSIEHT